MGLLVDSTLGPDLSAPTDPAGLIVIERLTGALSVEKLTELTVKLAERWAPNVSVRLLVDLNDAIPAGFGWQGLVEFAAHVDRIGLHTRIPRVALVASRDEIVALARLYKSLVRHDAGVAVFTEAEPALEWLRLPDTATPQSQYRVAPAAVRVLPRR
ncbi:MAG TPA: STAS/SEC14 domain-containing protein [Polyangiaceae bacterium]|nr:STAS/SEC14 domain-containing protein [Polyangiaceae bacterium]